jgi:probable HAF family extracellular repeat protein
MKLVFPFAIAFSLCLAAAQPKYVITDLGSTGPGLDAVPEGGINTRGEIAGWASAASPFFVQAFRTPPNGVLSPASVLGTLGGALIYSQGRAINSKGQVTGISHNANFSIVRSFRTVGGASSITAADDLGTLGGSRVEAFGINSSGQVVGFSSRLGLANGAFRTGPDIPINPATDDLGSLTGPAGFSTALGINDSGQVAGYSQNTSGQMRAFRTAPDCPWCKIAPGDDLGTLGGADSGGRAINNSGQVAGNSLRADGIRHAFRTGPNLPINPATDDLGSFGGTSFAYAINNAGDVVGTSSTAANVLRAFLYKDGALYDLNDAIPSGTQWIRLAGAYGINDLGQITGYGFFAGDSLAHAFRLDPPAVALGILRSQVASSTLRERQALVSSLNAAGSALGRGNTQTAVKELKTFINQIEVLRKTGRIDEADATAWIDAANALIAVLS